MLDEMEREVVSTAVKVKISHKSEVIEMGNAPSYQAQARVKSKPQRLSETMRVDSR